MSFQNENLTGELITAVLRDGTASQAGVHGLGHWRRVEQFGLEIAATSGADRDVVSHFALFHDSCRLNDGHDPEHGPRGAALARRFFKAGRLGLSENQMELLHEACTDHTYVHYSSNPTVATCFDADRLDLGRVGITPNPKFLNTDAGKAKALKT